MNAAASLLSMALAIACLGKIIREPLVVLRPHEPRAVLRQSLPMMMGSLLPQSALQMTLWVVALAGSAVEVAQYGVAVRLLQGLTMLVAVSNLLGAPLVAELHATSDRRRLVAVAGTLATVSAVPIVLMTLAVMVVGEQLMTLVFGTFYKSAASVVVALGIGRSVQVLLGHSPMILMMTGHERPLVLIQTAAALSRPLAALLGYQALGIDGVAIGVAIVLALESLVLAILVRRRLGFWAVATPDPRPVFRVVRRRSAEGFGR